jgi:16S rRNA (cytosine967-C5)-methyltransferase
MKSNVRGTAVDILVKIEKSQAYSNLLLNQSIQKAELSVKDISLLTEMVYGTIQRKNTLDFYIEPFVKKGLNKLDLWVLVLLRLSVYQMVFLDRVPAHAIINEAVNIAKKRGHKGISGFVNGVLRSIQREGTRDIAAVQDNTEQLSLELSHPTWLLHRWMKYYGKEQVTRMCQMNLRPPHVTARVNTHKSNMDDVIDMLKKEGIEVKRGELAEESLQVVKGALPKSNTFQEGYVTIQDESSMLVAHALDVSADQHVLDACAAPGGKTTHLAERMNNQGHITALDLHPHKIKLIITQAERLGLTNISAKDMDSRDAINVFKPASFDRILLDAPCSGFGVIRRKPDIKWTKTEQDIAQIASIQKQLLDSVSKLLKPGGLLVYSTCTIEKEENSGVVDAFLTNHADFTLDPTLENRLPKQLHRYMEREAGQVQLLPHYFETDGFYIACLKKI